MSMVTPTPDNFEEFKYILKIHQHLVIYLGMLFNGADYSSHDMSKYEEPEITPYTLKFICKLPNTQNPAWENAKQHHFQNNDHHIEYWKFYQKEMPLDRLDEAIVDMMAAKFQYNLNPSVVEAVRVNKYDIDLDKLVVILRDYLNKHDMYFFLDRFLGEYSDSQKEIINSKLREFERKFKEGNL